MADKAKQAFADSVKPQTIPLSVLDLQTSFANIPYNFIYENTSSSNSADGYRDGFMPSDKLQIAFYKTLEEFPIFAGNLATDSKGQTNVVVDRDNLNWPEYKESQSTVDFGKVKEHGLHWKHWPRDLATCGPICLPSEADGRIKLVSVHVVRLKNNSGLMLFFNIPHYVVDGHGYFAFINRWAELTQKECSLVDTVKAVSHSFDRSLVTDSVVRTPGYTLDRKISDIYTTPSLIASWLAWLSPKTRGHVLSKLMMMTKAEGHLFFISNEALDALRQQVAEHCPADMRISYNDLLVSLVAKLIAQAKKSHQEETSKGIVRRILDWFSTAKKPSVQSLSLAVDVRHRIGITHENYTGNAQIAQVMHNTLQELEKPTSASTLATVAQVVRNAVNGITSPMIAEFINMCSSDPTRFTRPMVFSAQNPNAILISNQTRFKMYDPDFGAGKPLLATPLPNFVPNMAAFMPTTNADGVNVFLSTAVEEMKYILNNDFWAERTQLIF